MPESYQKTIQVMEPECDYQQRIFLSQLMRHSQEISSEHLLHKGIDYNQMYRDGMVFLVNKLLMKLTRRPTFGEQVVVTTIPRSPKGRSLSGIPILIPPRGNGWRRCPSPGC